MRGAQVEVAGATSTEVHPGGTFASTPVGAGVDGGRPPRRRAYDASGRRAAAERRRVRVAVTAAGLFAECGWRGTTLAAVAREAEVSPEYVTKTFGGKPGLLMASMRSASFGTSGSLHESFTALQLGAEPDRGVRLDRFVDFACDAVVPMAPFVPVLAQGADEDERMRTVLQAARDGHVETIRALVPLLASGPVHPDTVDEVVVLTRAETYLTLAEERGWSVARYAAWLRRSIARAVGLTA
ncbi:TetR/AcrR family transcriptional regulator [Nocardioides flavus (ex Wang et al. 2016)]|uniref:TetR/AcrR family transcriptional regulator n=1 Tax=Nocardioides flavus (ex Wang et al. 2016) TaxID=2058780 RepID=UPI001747E113|nr:TetR family transcriptional regulator [Nocardioides flavus (ex Wang et al. 2016)]